MWYGIEEAGLYLICMIPENVIPELKAIVGPLMIEHCLIEKLITIITAEVRNWNRTLSWLPKIYPLNRRRRKELVITLTELIAMAAAARAGLAIMHHTVLLNNEVIVVGVATDPKPQHAIRDTDTQGAIRNPDADGPKPANLFEM